MKTDQLKPIIAVLGSTFKTSQQIKETMFAILKGLVFWQWALLTVLICLFIECFIFNGRFWTFSEQDYPRMQVNLPQNSGGRPEVLVDANHAQITVSDLDLSLKTVRIVTSSNSEQNLRGTVSLCDTSSYFWLLPANSFLLNPGGSQADRLFFLDPRGRVNKLQLTFQQPFAPFALTGLILNEPPAFSFSALRLVLLCAISLLLLSVWYFRLYFLTVTYAESRLFKACSLAVLTCVLLLSLGYFLLTSPLYTNPISYDLLGEVNVELTSPRHELLKPLPENLEELKRADEYVQQLSALRHGQLNLEFPWDPKLDTLKNPFDRSERAQAGVREYFDMVVHDHKYYMPHGLTPLLMAYLPVYFLTGKVPVPALANFLCALPALLALFFAMQVMLRTLVVRGNFLVTLLAELAVLCCSGVFLLQMTIAHYALNTLCGMTALALWCSFVYALPLCRSERSLRYMLVLAGICLVLLVHSRPHLVLLSLTLGLPFLCSFALQRLPKAGKADLLRNVACLGLPVLLGALLTMIWNYARFDDPLGLVTSKVMSLTDQRYLPEVSFAHLLNAWWYFLFEPVTWVKEFPFLQSAPKVLPDQGRVLNMSTHLGLFTFPVMWGLFLFFFRRRSTPQLTPDKAAMARTFNLSCALSFCAVLLIAYIFIYASGMNLRYTFDLTATAGLLSLVLITLSLRWGHSVQSRILCALVIFLLCKSIFLGLLVPFGFDEYSLFKVANPDGYIALAGFLQPFSY